MDIIILKCRLPSCRKSFAKTHHAKLYCSHFCENKHGGQRYRKRHKKLPVVVLCSWCKRQFIRRDKRSRCCSVFCRNRYDRLINHVHYLEYDIERNKTRKRKLQDKYYHRNRTTNGYWKKRYQHDHHKMLIRAATKHHCIRKGKCNVCKKKVVTQWHHPTYRTRDAIEMCKSCHRDFHINKRRIEFGLEVW